MSLEWLAAGVLYAIGAILAAGVAAAILIGVRMAFFDPNRRKSKSDIHSN